MPAGKKTKIKDKNMKKKILLLLSILAFTIITAFAGNYFIKNVAYADEQTPEMNHSVFLVSPTMIASTTNGEFIYDTAHKSIKQLKEDIVSSYSVYMGDILAMQGYEDDIYMLTNNSIKIYDTSTFDEKEAIDLSSWVEPTHTKLTISKINDNPAIIVYGNSTTTPIKYIFKESGTWKTEEISISVDVTQNAVDNLLFISVDSTVYLIRTYGKDISAYYPVNFGASCTLNTATALTISANDAMAEDKPIKNINYFDDTLILTYGDHTSIYNFSVTGGQPSIILESEDKVVPHTYNGLDFEAINTAKNNDSVFLLSTAGYYKLNAVSATISGFITNPACNISALDSRDYKYYKLNTSTNFIPDLGNEEGTFDIEEGEYVTEIATVTLGDTITLSGYKYVLYTKYQQDGNAWVGKNYYGYLYIDNDTLISIDPLDPEETIIKVNDQTNLYAYPSVVQDSKNQIVYKISQNLPVIFIKNLAEYQTGYNDAGQTYKTNFALVQVGDYVGFIDISRQIPQDKRVILALPNAKIIANTNIYESADKSSLVIGKLKENDAVKIIGRRDQTGMIKIAYNDQAGNYYEGYILASYVRSNSYTTLQIVGTVLVVLNILFLLVLIATRKKIDR